MSCDLMNNSKTNNCKTALLQLHDDVVIQECYTVNTQQNGSTIIVYEGVVGTWLLVAAGRNLSRSIPLWCCMHGCCCFLLMFAGSLP